MQILSYQRADMKLFYIAILFFCFGAFTAKAQQSQTIKKKGYTLTFNNFDNTLSAHEQQKMINTFFEVYPKLAKAYNKETLREVIIVVDTTYKGVAATSNGKVRISSRWMHLHPEDLDVITHEVMHIVQDYKESVGPGWLTEGIADYARYKFGINNDAAKWSLPPYKEGQNYTNSYRITARFLVWVEKNVKKNMVKELDRELRAHTYVEASWQLLTKKSLDELWKDYTANPEI